MKILKNIFSGFLSAIYPNKCICCGEIIDESRCVCDVCNKNIERNDFLNICLQCGLDKSDCVCKHNVYRFESLICVYKNTGLARNAYYKYKFGHKEHYVKFFANEMADAINYCYANLDFDFICSVPSYKSKTYNHSGYIAQELSKILNIKYVGNVLSCKKRTKKQHRSTIKERLSNIDGKFKYNFRIDGARVLLVDDIKTTGATIDECAKILLYAGADSVHCVTVLGTTNFN